MVLFLCTNGVLVERQIGENFLEEGEKKMGGLGGGGGVYTIAKILLKKMWFKIISPESIFVTIFHICISFNF